MKKFSKIFLFSLAFVLCTLVSCASRNTNDYLHITFESDQILLQEGASYEIDPIINNGDLGQQNYYGSLQMKILLNVKMVLLLH